MGANSLKKHTVRVGEGSGCVFQPMDDQHTYILTAKHLFQQENKITKELEYVGDSSEIQLTFLEYDDNSWECAKEPFTVQLDQNYFPHKYADAAILKIPHREGYDNIHIRKKRVKGDYHLCGFPGVLLHQPTVSSHYDSEEIKSFLQSDDFFDVAQLENSTLNYSEIEGYSGGGIMIFDEADNVFVTGIQSRMAKEKLSLDFGKIGFIPIRYFEEIIEDNKEKGKLEELLPVFLKSFIGLIGDAFRFASAGIIKEEKALSELLSAKAQFIQQSDLTPLEFKAFLGDQRLLIRDQDNVELKRKKVWTFWLELLVILNIVKDKIHNVEDLELIVNKIRFFYSDIDQDFLTAHLQDLWKLDYTDLEDDGLVIFASNQIYQSSGIQGILDLREIIPDISSARRKFEFHQNQLIGTGAINITEARVFPFDRFRYTNLTTFKEYASLELDKSFVDMNPNECYPLLKELYEKLLP